MTRRVKRVAVVAGAVVVLGMTIGCSSTPAPPPPAGPGAISTPATASGTVPSGTGPSGTGPMGTAGPRGTIAPVTATMTSVTEVEGAYRQGVARVPDGWIFSTNFALYRTTEDPLEVTVKNEAAIPQAWLDKGYNHIGDVDVVNGIVYAPVEREDKDLGRQAMFRYDAATLQFLDGVEVAQHHNSFVTVDPATLIAYSMDFFGGQAFLRYDTQAGWKALDPLPMASFVDKVQGADIAEGSLWLASDDDAKDLVRVVMASGQTDVVGTIEWKDGETEGIDATALGSGLLHVLSIDAKFLPVRFAHFAVR